ncbi:cadmium resistance transporter [Companilactobacillus metriopterae]|uniref:cadmium resistance transporter n=1 Tax=Companilactobacillus metriopterae TaxID=1909267 RepID=UPI00100BF2E8|nr:cadmium resistance transporter [Companilactobacillus metriopterae]
MKTILLTIAAYCSTSIDYLIILTILFSGIKTKNQRWVIYWGDFLGTSVLIGVSLLFGLVLNFVPDEWILGLLGIIPIIFGIKILISNDDDSEVSAQFSKNNHIVMNVAIITVTSCGADNLGIYIPVFSQINISEIPIMLITFFIMMSIFCYIGYLISKAPGISSILDRWQKYITSSIYIIIGSYILFESGTISHFI